MSDEARGGDAGGGLGFGAGLGLGFGAGARGAGAGAGFGAGFGAGGFGFGATGVPSSFLTLLSGKRWTAPVPSSVTEYVPSPFTEVTMPR